MLTKIKQNEFAKLSIGLFMVVVVCILSQSIGLMKKVTNSVDTLGMAIVGYESKEYVVKGANPTPVAMMMGVSIEQEIYLSQEIVDHESFMLEIDVANYERINNGQLVCEIHQDDVVKVFVTEMSQITENMTLRLITDTKGFKKGNIMVNMYAPLATGDNCVAVYALIDANMYPGLRVCGEETKQNACIDLAIPSDFAKSDFHSVN